MLMEMWGVSGCILQIRITFKISNTIGYSRKQTNRELRTYFFENIHGIFCLFTLPLEIRDKSKLHPWKLCKIALYPMEIP